MLRTAARRFSISALTLACVLGSGLCFLGCPEPGEGDPSASAPDLPEDEDSGETAGNVAGRDVKSVTVGQVYRFKVSAPLEGTEAWKITEVVPGKNVVYELTSTTKVEGIDEPNVMTSPNKSELPEPPTGDAAREVLLKVGALEFACKVYESEKTKIWWSNRFPFEIKREEGGETARELVAVTQPAAPKTKTKTESKTAKTGD